MKLITGLVLVLLALAVVSAGAREALRGVGPVPLEEVALALLYMAVVMIGYLRLRSKKEPKPTQRLPPRRRALPPAPGGDA